MAKKTRKKKTFDLTLPIYQIEISLQYIKPRIWRKVLTDDCSLRELHCIIQECMGWEDCHAYAFVIGDKEYRCDEECCDLEPTDSMVRLSDVVGDGHTRFRYDYDFGDEWRHTIEIQKTLPAEQGIRYPRCIGGKRAAPPEDSGGPHRYPEFVTAIKDPEHEQHDQVLEWTGDEFDPEEFVLDKVNEELAGLRRILGKAPGNLLTDKPTFREGDLVCVKPGVCHEPYADIPLSGWVGKVLQIQWLTPISYTICWTAPTLDLAHDVFLKRCQRDSMRPNKYWIDQDQLEAAANETPEAMEQPKNIVTRPLSRERIDDRVREVFALTSDDGLPRMNEETLGYFLEHLKAHLSFPFTAAAFLEDVIGRSGQCSVRVAGFANPPIEPTAGLVCEVHYEDSELPAPLAILFVGEDDPNFEYLEDYAYWAFIDEGKCEYDDEDEWDDDEDGDEDGDEDDDRSDDEPI